MGKNKFTVTKDVNIVLNGEPYILEAGDTIMIWDDRLAGGVADHNVPSDFDEAELEVGTEVEHEHTDDDDVAKEIAMDHMAETGEVGEDGKIHSDYYKLLDKMEKELEG